MANEEIFLEASQAGWQARGRTVLRDITLSLRPGEFFVIMGPNGCGKTVLLKILAGLILPTEGSVKVGLSKESMLNVNEALEQRRIQAGFVFESGGLVSNLDIFDNIALPLRYPGTMPEAQVCKEVASVLSEFNLTGFAQTRPSEISPGIKKRAQIARAKVMNPEIVFYDDPQWGLDVVQNVLVRESILNLHKGGKRVSVVTTGSASWELKVADRIVVMDRGSIAAAGSLSELRAHPSALVQEMLQGDSHAH